MKKLRRILKFFLLLLVILLASVGVGIAGGVPHVLGNRKQANGSDIRIELFEDKREDEEMEILDLN